MVEGVSDARCKAVQDHIQILQYIGDRDAQHLQPLLYHISVTRRIAACPVAHVMGCAVDLDDKPERAAIEISHIGSDRVLAAKLYAEGIGADALPDQHFG